MATHLKKSLSLLKDLKRSRWLPPYNDKAIKEVVEEILHDTREMNKIWEEEDRDPESLPPEVAMGVTLYNDLVDRNRRCLLAYLMHRLEKIESLRWEVGLMVPEEKLAKMHESEKQYFHHYNACLDRYMKRYVSVAKEPLDLTADAKAPEDTNVQIRVHDEGVGDIVTSDSGILKLRKGWVHTVKRTDVEYLIRAGKVEHVKQLRVDDLGA
mmetsp:Transcript_105386/g.183291  ORF Transcript_105386/g.183291 Transcript_105386/m.183291 type:complete len:211 (-) Transcript_105386:118-750(-)